MIRSNHHDFPDFLSSKVKILSLHTSEMKKFECRKRMSIEAASSIVNYFSEREKLNLTNVVNKEHLDI